MFIAPILQNNYLSTYPNDNGLQPKNIKNSHLSPSTRSYHVNRTAIPIIEKPISFANNPAMVLHFFSAIQKGDEKEVELMIKQDTSLSTIRLRGSTPLAHAFWSGQYQIAEFLFNKGANINEITPIGISLLSWVVKNGDLAAAEWLVDHGAKIDFKDKCNQTTLHHCVRDQESNMLKILLKNPTNVNVKDAKGKTPLHLAVIVGKHELIPILVEHGANTKLRTSKGDTPLQISYCGKTLKCLKELLKHGADINAKDREGNSLLMWAIEDQKNDIFEELIKHPKINVNQRNNEQQTPIYTAIKADQYTLVEKLIKKGANLQIVKRDGSTPLMCAIYSNASTCQKIIEPLDKGFSQFCIELKLLAHRFGMDVAVDIGGVENIDLNGFYPEFAYPHAAQSFRNFYPTYQKELPANWTNDDWEEVAKIVEDTCRNAQKIASIDWEHLPKNQIVAFSAGWKVHSTSLVYSYYHSPTEPKKIAQGNRGNSDCDKIGIKFSTIGKPENINQTFIKALSKTTQDLRNYCLHGINSDLELVEDFFIEHKDQPSGNCVWIAAKLTLKSVLYFKLTHKGCSHTEALSIATTIYKNWFYEDRIWSLKQIHCTNKNLVIPKELKNDIEIALEILCAEILFYNIKTNRINMVREILNLRPELMNIQDDVKNEAPLHIAAKNGFLNLALLLVEKGADVNIINDDGKTPRDIAKQNKNSSMLKILQSRRVKA